MNHVSVNILAWQKLKINKLFIASSIYILIAIFFSFFAVILSPDKTSLANEMHLELVTLPPLTSINFLEIPNNNETDMSFLNSFFFGEILDYDRIPLDSFNQIEEGLIYFRFNSLVEEKYLGEYCINNQTFWFGTDRYGRDMLSRIIHGIRISLSVGFIAVFISLIIGVFLGLLAGYFRGLIDNIIMWFVNVVWSIPTLLMVIAITLALGKGFWQIFIAVGLTMWVEVARIVRGQVIYIRELQYIEAGKVLGYNSLRIIFKHIFPNIIGPVIVISAANFASAILIEAGLSFLGIGVQPPMPSWGGMIKDHYTYIIMDKAYLAIIPGFFIMITVLAFMLIGNALRDAFDVKN